MEIGTVFWIVIAYSVVGWFLFRTIVRVSANALTRGKEEVEVSVNQATIAAILLVVGAIVSGPMTWGNFIRSWLVQRDQPLQD